VLILNLAAIYIDSGKPEKAEKILRELRERVSGLNEHYSNIGAIHINLGAAYIKMNDYKKALESYKDALVIMPHSPLVLFSIGECYDRLSDEKHAKEYFELATRGISQKAQDFISQGTAFFKIGDNKKAILSFNEAIRVDPFDVNARIFLGNTLIGNKYYAESFKIFFSTSKLSPNHAPAYTGMGKAMLATGNLREARKHFNKALSLLPPASPERKEILELLGKAE